MGRLDGKVAVITGGSSGIGRTSALLFAREGAKVVVGDCQAKQAEETVESIRRVGGESTFAIADVSVEAQVKAMIETAIQTFGKLDILFNNAGICISEPLIESSEKTFDKIIAMNLKGVWFGMKYAIPEMIRNGRGSIVNTASICADAAQRGLSIYGASKGAIVSMSKAAAVEYAAHGIRVNCIKPGVIQTPMAMATLKNNSAAMQHIENITPLGRLGEAAEIARLALFLASEDSSYITGTEILADGGLEADSHIV